MCDEFLQDLYPLNEQQKKQAEEQSQKRHEAEKKLS